MNPAICRRLKKEIEEIKASNQECLINIEVKNDDMTELEGSIKGPPDSPYEGGQFFLTSFLTIKLTQRHPFTPPKVRFITKLWHPNVSSVTGCICMDILGKNWAPAMSLKSLLLSVQLLLLTPEPEDPLDSIVAGQYQISKKTFLKTACYWTHVFANGQQNVPEFEKKTEELVVMGFGKEQSTTALSYEYWNEERAVARLME